MISYCIPSYRRADVIGRKTLAFLERHKVPAAQIHIFVASPEEKDAYTQALPSYSGRIFVGRLGISQQRQYICDSFPNRRQLVFMDDDITDVKQLRGENGLTHVRDFQMFCEEAFRIARSHKANLWGVYPVANGMFMKKTVTTDLRFIRGTLYGQINRKRDDLRLTLPEKEDYENTLKHFIADGAVLRFNHVSFITPQVGKGSGGLQSVNATRRAKQQKAASKVLLTRYPGMVKPSQSRKRGFAEVRLIAGTAARP
jgi:hypothetical protein